MPISLQSGIREYNGDLSQYTGMQGGLTPDIHTLRSLNPLTTNRVLCVMYRGPWFLQHYFKINGNAYDGASAFGTYKKIIEYYNQGITLSMGDQTLGTVSMQGGFAGRSIPIPTTQNQQSSQSFEIKVTELDGRPMANFHNMWVDGIADPITGLCTYQGLVSGSEDENHKPQRIFSSATGADELALEPSPAWEVAEFLFIALDRSGARPEAAVMALGCVPANKIGNEIFNYTNTGNSELNTLNLRFNCQFVQSTYVNDLAARYLQQFAVFGNSLNFNPGAGDAFFKSADSTIIDTPMFNGGTRPTLDSVQSGLGNAPVFSADPRPIVRKAPAEKTLTPADHSKIYTSENDTTPIDKPYRNRGGE